MFLQKGYGHVPHTDEWKYKVEILDQIVGYLKASTHWGYRFPGPSASEPASLVCLALAGRGLSRAAQRPAQWLLEIQQANGAVGVSAAESTPAWTTSLAILAWTAVDANNSVNGQGALSKPIEEAVRWSLSSRGTTVPRKLHVGHDTTIIGWSWAAATHSWLEPTCYFTMALKAAGQGAHARVSEGVRLIVDRLLPDGGCNYGNTIVLGQSLLPHLQPTGLAMMALAGESCNDPRIEKSVQYLDRTLESAFSKGVQIPTASLCYAMMGLAAHHHMPACSKKMLQSAMERELLKPSSPHKCALLALAAANKPFNRNLGIS
jgi:hypothetical protein